MIRVSRGDDLDQRCAMQQSLVARQIEGSNPFQSEEQPESVARMRGETISGSSSRNRGGGAIEP